jgi:peptidoglycan/xylan/chitin deacetylase (PgdA/CDA1 family)
MRVTDGLKTAIRLVDNTVATLSLSLGNETHSLLSFLFHGLFCDVDEVRSEMIDPQQGISVGMFREFISHFYREGYRFVSPTDIVNGLDPAGKYVLVTFDDGYYNHARALPVMEEFNVPATFFLSSRHVIQQKAFWWDVVYRALKKRGHSYTEIQNRVAEYKVLPPEEIDRRLTSEFGDNALRVSGDLDRPFTSRELFEFSQHRLVSIGNHTRNHAILVNLSAREMRDEIQGAQDELHALSGKTPIAIAYPNGNCSKQVLQAAREAGLQLGVSVNPGKNRLPLSSSDSDDLLRLKRFTIWGDSHIDPQCRTVRSNFSLKRTLLAFKNRRAHAAL